MSSTSIERCIQYSHPESGALSKVFNFHHLKVDYVDGRKWTYFFGYSDRDLEAERTVKKVRLGKREPAGA